MNAVTKAAVRLPLDAITLDPELQPRAVLDTATWQDYLYLLGDGVTLPPVTVFHDGATHWLADGYHRWHAHKALGAADILAHVHRGSRDSALLFSLSANAAHGRRREPGDYRKAYETACRHGFVPEPDNVEAVRDVLRCSARWAYDLTEPARQKIKQERDAKIVALKSEGKSNRAIAREVGVDRRTIDRQVIAHESGADLQTAKTPHTEPPQEPPGLADFRDMTSERGERWWGALRAMEAICAAASVDDLMADRYSGIEHVFDPVLIRAHAWINELHRRYFNAD